MALMRCPDCGNEFSDRAAACPKCAAPIGRAPSPQPVFVQMPAAPAPKKRSSLATIGCLGLLGLLGLCIVFGVIANKQNEARERAAAEKAFADGKAAFDSKNWSQAYPLLEQAAKLKTDDPALPKMIAEARQHHREALVADAAKAEGAGDLDRTIMLLEQANGVSPTSEIGEKLKATKYLAGKKALDDKRFDRAYALLQSVIGYKDAGPLADVAKREMDYAEASSLLAKAEDAAKSGKADEALKLLDQAEPKATPPSGKPSIKDRIAALRGTLLDAVYVQAGEAATKGDIEKALDLYKRLGKHKDAATKAADLEVKVAAKKKTDEAARGEVERKAEAARLEKELAGLRSDVTFERINEMFGLESKWTDLKKDAEWPKYEGKLVHWRGTVVEVSKTLGTITLDVKHLSTTFTFDVQVSLRDNQKKRAANLTVGGPVRYEGKLGSRGGAIVAFSVNDAVVNARWKPEKTKTDDDEVVDDGE